MLRDMDMTSLSTWSGNDYVKPTPPPSYLQAQDYVLMHSLATSPRKEKCACVKWKRKWRNGKRKRKINCLICETRLCSIYLYKKNMNFVLSAAASVVYFLKTRQKRKAWRDENSSLVVFLLTLYTQYTQLPAVVIRRVCISSFSPSPLFQARLCTPRQWGHYRRRFSSPCGLKRNIPSTWWLWFHYIVSALKSHGKSTWVLWEGLWKSLPSSGVIGCFLFFCNSSRVFWSSRRSILVPTKMIGVCGQWWRNLCGLRDRKVLGGIGLELVPQVAMFPSHSRTSTDWQRKSKEEKCPFWDSLGSWSLHTLLALLYPTERILPPDPQPKFEPRNYQTRSKDR